MRRFLFVFSLAAVVTTAGAPAVAASNVPCGIFSGMPGYPQPGPCANPFMSGVVDGQWVGVVMMLSGGNGGARSAHVYASGHGGNGPLTVDLGVIEAITEYQGAGPDGLEIFFHNGKLIAANKLAHDLWKHYIVRQYGFHDRKLVVEKTVKFDYERQTWSESDFESDAEKALLNVSSQY